jgi:tRNA(Arg) A34 adenosine deaminase TadA
MRLAIDQAKISLREGNCGFGAAIIKDGQLIAKARDTEKTAHDATAHAEIEAIRTASAKLGRDLSGCILVSTHEPCPMCSTAALWSGISELAYGFSIKEAISRKRRRINITCKEIYERAGQEIILHQGILKAECSVLYDNAVRDNIELLRDADQNKLEKLAEELSEKRLKWFSVNHTAFETDCDNLIDTAYQLFLYKLDIGAEDAPIVGRDASSLVLHSTNFCPTLEACNILDIDTRFVCRHLTEKPTTDLLRQIHPKLRFTRNYERLRPYTPYCEEMIILDE